MKHIIFGTAGHIDHGKSALVMALTGTDPDRLEEEKQRGITIDLGFAYLDLGEGLRASFIDVPGHERFIKNMLAGATGIDVVILVVAADESIKPQTREHFDICRLLGVRRGLVAITKSDLVERDIVDLVRMEIQEFVAGSFLEEAPIVAVSVRSGEGLDTLKAELRRLTLAITARPASLPARLPIDRAFIMKGFGPVITGTLIAGKIEKESELEIFPLARRVRVRGIQVHNAAATEAVAGQRTALNLAGIDAKEIRRGMMLSDPGEFLAAGRLDCVCTLLPSARPLKNRSRVHFHCWTAETAAEVVLLEGREVRPGGRAYAQLRLAEPGLFLPGDRFILRQFSPVVTIGGGSVLDNLPDRRRASDGAAMRLLHALEDGDRETRLQVLLESSGEATLAVLGARTGWGAEGVLRVAKDLAGKRRLLVLGVPPSHLLSATALEELAKSVLEIIGRFHAENPLVPGIAREELRGQARFGKQVPSLTSFQAALQALAAAQKIEIREDIISLAGRGIRLNAEEERARQEMNRAFEAAGLRVPAANEVLGSLGIDRGRAEKILQILLREKVLYKVADGLIFHRAALEGLRELIETRKAQSNRLSVPAFKELTGVTRKYAIPLLEYLDRERITRRAGDERIIL